MADGARDSSMLGIYPLMMPCSGLISKWSRPILPRWAAQWAGVLIRNPTGEQTVQRPRVYHSRGRESPLGP